MIPPIPLLKSIAPYVPGEQPTGSGFIKLNTNEFPYPAAPEVIEAIRREATDAVRLYPSPRSEKLRARLAELHEVGTENILVGNGSDEILRLLIQAWCSPDRTAAVVEPSYSLYPTLIAMTGAKLQVFQLEAMTRLPEALFDDPYDLLLLPVPNPPLGTLIPSEELRRLAERDSLLVLDQAYADFTDSECGSGLIRDFHNVVLVRTFSKSRGLAGMRIGYAAGSKSVIETLSKIADSYNVNRISQAAAIGALDAKAYYDSKVNKICEDREWLRGELTSRGFAVAEGEGNFLFARREDAESIQAKLKDRKIFVRRFDGTAWADGLRITIGTTEELMALLAALDSL